jgi:hypothetical protein
MASESDEEVAVFGNSFERNRTNLKIRKSSKCSKFG